MKKEKKTIKISNEIPDYIKCPRCSELLEIKHIIRQTLQRFIEETKLMKMDYLKWELREDLTGRYHTTDLKKATERAKGWNAFKDKINQKQQQWLKENLLQ